MKGSLVEKMVRKAGSRKSVLSTAHPRTGMVNRFRSSPAFQDGLGFYDKLRLLCAYYGPFARKQGQMKLGQAICRR